MEFSVLGTTCAVNPNLGHRHRCPVWAPRRGNRSASIPMDDARISANSEAEFRPATARRAIRRNLGYLDQSIQVRGWKELAFNSSSLQCLVSCNGLVPGTWREVAHEEGRMDPQ